MKCKSGISKSDLYFGRCLLIRIFLFELLERCLSGPGCSGIALLGCLWGT